MREMVTPCNALGECVFIVSKISPAESHSVEASSGEAAHAKIRAKVSWSGDSR